jgi:hypothetical protein
MMMLNKETYSRFFFYLTIFIVDRALWKFSQLAKRKLIS